MDRTITRLPAVSASDPLESALLEIDIAIALVLAGIAVTVTLCCLEAGEGAAFTAAAWAQSVGVAFHLWREPGVPVRLVIGPRLGLSSLEAGFEMES